MIAALATGTSHIRNYSSSADCAATLSCLLELGVQIDQNGSEITIQGVGDRGLQAAAVQLDCGNSGTTMRLLAGILAGQNFQSVLTGDESLRSRPMQRIIEPLQMMGATFSSHNGRAPLTIEGRRPLKTIDYELIVASAQVKSCILLAGMNAQGKTTVIENELTRDHTERMLRVFGANIETGTREREPANACFASVIGPAQLQACDVAVPGDISSAAYFIAAAALRPRSVLEIRDVGLNPTRTGFLRMFESMNAVELSYGAAASEPVGRIKVSSVNGLAARVGLDSLYMINGLAVAQMIDELPLLAVVGSQFEQCLEIRDAKELRVKESDRISATVENLRAMGAEVTEFDDGLRVHGPAKLRGAKIDPRGDHRIAMAFTVAALIAEGPSEIVDADSVAVSFPEFFETLESVVER